MFFLIKYFELNLIKVGGDFKARIFKFCDNGFNFLKFALVGILPKIFVIKLILSFFNFCDSSITLDKRAILRKFKRRSNLMYFEALKNKNNF